MAPENAPESVPETQINGVAETPIRYFMRLSFNGRDFHGWQIQQVFFHSGS